MAASKENAEKLILCAYASFYQKVCDPQAQSRLKTLVKDVFQSYYRENLFFSLFAEPKIAQHIMSFLSVAAIFRLLCCSKQFVSSSSSSSSSGASEGQTQKEKKRKREIGEDYKQKEETTKGRFGLLASLAVSHGWFSTNWNWNLTHQHQQLMPKFRCAKLTVEHFAEYKNVVLPGLGVVPQMKYSCPPPLEQAIKYVVIQKSAQTEFQDMKERYIVTAESQNYFCMSTKLRGLRLHSKFSKEEIGKLHGWLHPVFAQVQTISFQELTKPFLDCFNYANVKTLFVSNLNEENYSSLDLVIQPEKWPKLETVVFEASKFPRKKDLVSFFRHFVYQKITKGKKNPNLKMNTSFKTKPKPKPKPKPKLKTKTNSSGRLIEICTVVGLGENFLECLELDSQLEPVHL